MRNRIKKAKGDAKKAPVGASSEGTPREESPKTFDPAKANAKEIFEDARAKQDEDFIRLGKPQ
jgi:hypothetical protein